jgi:nucleotide-binding universal stress UspA family protein
MSPAPAKGKAKSACLVVGCKRHSRLRKAIGTVTSELLKSSPVPVTAVPR